MSLLFGHDVPYIETTKDGTVYRLPVQQQGSEKSGYRPVPVARSPKLALPPPIAIAGPEGGQFRRNYDIDEAFLIDWSRGMSVDIYPPNAPPAGFQYSDLDTRADGYLTAPPLRTELGFSLSGRANPGEHIVYLGMTNATLLRWQRDEGAYRLNGTTWTRLQSSASNLTFRAATVGVNGIWAVGYNAGAVEGVYRSQDGVTWDTMASPGTTPTAVATFDEKVWVLRWATSGSTNTYTVYSSADVTTAAAAGGTWTAGNSFITHADEQVSLLFTWQYPLDRGKPTLWCLTTARLYYYDFYAATPTWHIFDTNRQPFGYDGYVRVCDAYVWPKNGNLYVCWGYDGTIVEYTGNTITPIYTNRGGGLPPDRRVTPVVLGGDNFFLYAFCAAYRLGADGPGAVLAMAEGGAFHQIYAPASNTYLLAGGGVGPANVWVAYRDNANAQHVVELPNPELPGAPYQITADRTYDAGAYSLVTGWLHANLLNVNKRLLYFEVDSIRADGAPGLDTGCTIQVEYRRRGGSFVSAGTLTSADTFPAVLAISGGYSFKELQLRVTLQRGSDATRSTYLKALKLGYRPRPKQRYTYTARVDLRDGSPAFATDDEKFHGRSASFLRGILDELSDNDDLGLDDTLVALAYGGFGNLLHPRRRSASQCEVTIQAQESPDGGDGLYLLMFNAVEAPTSG